MSKQRSPCTLPNIMLPLSLLKTTKGVLHFLLAFHYSTNSLLKKFFPLSPLKSVQKLKKKKNCFDQHHGQQPKCQIYQCKSNSLTWTQITTACCLTLSNNRNSFSHTIVTNQHKVAYTVYQQTEQIVIKKSTDTLPRWKHFTSTHEGSQRVSFPRNCWALSQLLKGSRLRISSSNATLI